jgi:hypothetical protein
MVIRALQVFIFQNEREFAVRLSEASHPRAFERKGGFVRVSSGHVRVFSFESMSFEATSEVLLQALEVAGRVIDV